MEDRDHYRDRDETDDCPGRGCHEPTLRHHLAGPGTERRMSGLLGMMMRFGGRERHRCTAGRQHHQSPIQGDGQACKQTKQTGKATGRHDTYFLILFSTPFPFLCPPMPAHVCNTNRCAIEAPPPRQLASKRLDCSLPQRLHDIQLRGTGCRYQTAYQAHEYREKKAKSDLF
jgi:hypothetical protein